MIMRTRSSRFFVVLLHLVGVSHFHPPTLYGGSPDSEERRQGSSSRSGIVGVQPWPIQLEAINLLEDSLSENGAAEPIWMQDETDGSCLGPAGTFSECGDATLWFVERSSNDNKQRITEGSSENAALTTFAFEVVDRDYEVFDASLAEEGKGMSSGGGVNIFRSIWNLRPRRRRKRQQRTECLDWRQPTVPRGQRRSLPRMGMVHVERCGNRKKALWSLQGSGVLRAHSNRIVMGGFEDMVEEEQPMCLYRGKQRQALLAPCASEGTRRNRAGSDLQQVQFSFVRYRAVTVPTASATNADRNQMIDESGTAEAVSLVDETDEQTDAAEETTSSGHIPTSKDKAHSLASEPVMHPELKLPSGLMFKKKNDLKAKSDSGQKKKPLKNLLHGTNPILLMGDKGHKGRDFEVPSTLKSSSTSVGHVDEATYRLRRIQTHPYIRDSKNEIWTDPQTGLEYFTDLCKYLGRTREDFGRHTLTGVGQYRKGYVVKVYGVAYYISKRDALADPEFQRYSSYSTDQLRSRPEFYDHLRKMGHGSSPSAGLFDRTLLLKTNMQLSAETMRSSLHADWKMLTTEAKTALISSSLEPRPADERMLSIISSSENPSRCSCSQVAPEEYRADPSCCARGTELAFTWLKTGELEVRLNGQLMDVFPRADIAEGIFYEYLRYDDPISPELRDRVVDGFPFLLAPLAQVQGFNLHNAKTA